MLIVVATSGRDASLRLWDPVSHKQIASILTTMKGISRMRVINENGTKGWNAVGFDAASAGKDYWRIALGSTLGEVEIYDVRAGKVEFMLDFLDST